MANSVTEFSSSPAPKCDVVVVGGGPAGCTTATLLAQRGWSVTLFEKARHPRFHIGESLLPMNLPIFERLGILDAVERIGVRKMAAEIIGITGSNPAVFPFRRALDPTWPHAYQVKREELDTILFENAAANGVATFQGHRVSSVDFVADHAIVKGASDSGADFECSARYFVDATGRDTLLGTQFGIKRKHPQHQSAALFAHFSGVLRRPGENQGNITVCGFEHGWVWLIPLQGDVTSVGVVCWPEHLKTRRTNNREFLIQTLRSIPEVAERMENAEIIGNLHATGNYSYVCKKMTGPGWLMVGDAYTFVDPIFSSGVYLAMHGGEAAADTVDNVLRNPARERSLQRLYRKENSRGLATLSWFIFRFTSPAMRKLFANPRNDWQLEQAIISMLSGDVYRDNGVHWRINVFKVIYGLTAMGILGEQARSYLFRRRQTRAAFTGGTTDQDAC